MPNYKNRYIREHPKGTNEGKKKREKNMGHCSAYINHKKRRGEGKK